MVIRYIERIVTERDNRKEQKKMMRNIAKW